MGKEINEKYEPVLVPGTGTISVSAFRYKQHCRKKIKPRQLVTLFSSTIESYKYSK